MPNVEPLCNTLHTLQLYLMLLYVYSVHMIGAVNLHVYVVFLYCKSF